MASNVSSSNFVQITPQVSVAVGSGFSLVGLVLTKNTDFPLVPLSFNSASAVSEYAGSSSAEFAFASKYFAANDNKSRIPSNLLICGYNLAAQAGWIRGAAISAKLADLQTITDGVLTISFGGANVTLSSLDFSAQTSLSGVASVLQTALRAAGQTGNFTGATVTYSSQAKGFIIKSGATDETGAVGYAVAALSTGTDLGGILMLREADGAIISQVQAASTTLPAFMNGILNQTQSWFSFTKMWELADAADNQAEDLAFAEWNAQQGVRYAYFEHDKAGADVNINVQTDFASQLASQGIAGTVANYGTTAHCAFAMGTVAATNYDITGGRITVAFKTQSGLDVTCNNDTEYAALTAKGYNSYVRDGSAANIFFGYQRGVISGPYGFIDAYANHVWLNDQMQVALRALLGSANALPYNNFGYGQLLNAIKPCVDAGLNSGVIATGVTLADTQIAAIASETGLELQDVKNTLFQEGWLFQAKDPGAAVRAQRGTPDCRFYYCDGGAIQKIELISTAVR